MLGLSDATLVEVTRVTGLPFDEVERRLRNNNTGGSVMENEKKGQVFNTVHVNVPVDWGGTLAVANTTPTGVTLKNGRVCISVEAENVIVQLDVVVDAQSLIRAINCALSGEPAQHDEWGW